MRTKTTLTIVAALLATGITALAAIQWYAHCTDTTCGYIGDPRDTVDKARQDALAHDKAKHNGTRTATWASQ